MKIKNYKGFEISVVREKSLGGWFSIYYYIMRLSDGWFLEDNFSCEDKTPVKEFAEGLKEQVDEYYENPELFEE